MAYYNLQDVQCCPDWHINDKHERFQRSDCMTSPVALDMELYDEPMNRYLWESNRTLLKPNFTLSEMTMSSLPDLPFTSLRHTDVDTPFHSYRDASPTDSGRSSLVTADTSDCDFVPWTRLEPTSYTSVSGYHNIMTPDAGGYACYDGKCVALHDVQGYADTQPEKIAFHEDTQLPYAVSIQEGYQPIPVQRSYEPDVLSPVSMDQVVLDDCSSTTSKVRQQQTATHRRAAPVHHASIRVSKRTPAHKRSSTATSNALQNTKRTNQAFPCLFTHYGCESTFGSKNEWKRHTSTQHMRFGYWRCDQCSGSEEKQKDFNRKDLFMQHVRRMHPEKSSTALSSATKTNSRRPASTFKRKDKTENEYLQQASTRCYRRLRSPPPQSGCPFCPTGFSSWDDRMEHVGRHLEARRKDNSGRGVKKENLDLDLKCDEELEEWLLDEKLLTRKGRSLVLATSRRAE